MEPAEMLFTAVGDHAQAGGLPAAIDRSRNDAPPERWLVTRRTPEGAVEQVFTVFDAAMIALRLYEATGDAAWLREGLAVILSMTGAGPAGPYWSFSPAVEDSPADADTTACMLLLAHSAEAADLPAARALVKEDPTPLFEHAQNSAGGVRTYLTQRRNNDVDPVVNLCVAEWMLRSGRAPALRDGLKRYLDGLLAEADWSAPLSAYYLGNAFLAFRAARVAAIDPAFLGIAGCDRLDGFLQHADQTDPLATALALEASVLRGLADRARTLRRDLLRARGPDGAWPWCAFYAQRTPRYVYGSSLLTTTTSLCALRAAAALLDS